MWSALDNELRPSVSYIVTLALDPWTAVTGPAVQSLTMRLGQSENPRRQEMDGETAVATNIIGGTLLKGAQPQSGIDVALKGTGFMETTDEKWPLPFPRRARRQLHLARRSGKGKPQEKKITAAGDYDVEL